MEEKEIKRVKLAEIIDVANKFVSGEWDEKTMSEYGQTMNIRTYLPLMDKTSVVMALLTKHLYTDVNTQEIRVAELYRNLFFYVLLEQYAFIDCSDEKLVTYENYDLLYPIFGQFILSFCYADYEMVKEFLHDSINMYNINNMVESIESVDTEALQTAVEDNKKLIDALESNKELIEELNNIAALNDPNTSKVLEEIKKAAEKEVLEQE